MLLFIICSVSQPHLNNTNTIPKYQPKRAGNLPIPANPPVNKWDATLILIMNDDDDDELPLPEDNSKLVNS